ncbi:hypothetical protein ACFQ68_37405 [Amycolatopsis japonica]|uniref:hypothetical protein n=1 Tax=Amycolatopsis japonica TaxID=208439 RepID=UPI00366D154C
MRNQADDAIGEFDALTAAGVSDPVARQQVAIDSPVTYDGRTIAEHAIDRYMAETSAEDFLADLEDPLDFGDGDELGHGLGYA